jgi:hypothetical protein
MKYLELHNLVHGLREFKFKTPFHKLKNAQSTVGYCIFVAICILTLHNPLAYFEWFFLFKNWNVDVANFAHAKGTFGGATLFAC